MKNFPLRVARDGPLLAMTAALIFAVSLPILAIQPADTAAWVGALILTIGVAIAVVAVAVVTVVRAWRRKHVLFRQRADLSDVEIYNLHFAASGLPRPVVLALWDEVADVFGVPPGKLRPEDRFGVELGCSWTASGDLHALAAVATLRARLYGVALDFARIGNLGGYVRYFAAMKMDARAKAGERMPPIAPFWRVKRRGAHSPPCDGPTR